MCRQTIDDFRFLILRGVFTLFCLGLRTYSFLRLVGVRSASRIRIRPHESATGHTSDFAHSSSSAISDLAFLPFRFFFFFLPSVAGSGGGS